MESVLSTRGRVTLPKEIQDHLHLRPGDRVKFFPHPNGSVTILPMIPVSALRGILASRVEKPKSLEEMEAGIAAGATASFRRMRRSS